MRYLMALMLMWGVVSFSSAQEIQVDEDCPPTSKNEGVESDLEYDTEDEARFESEGIIESEGTESELEFENNQAEFDREIEQDGEAEIEYQDESLEYEMQTEEAAPVDTSVDMELEMDESTDCPNVDASTSDADINISNEVYTTPATAEVNVELEEENERSTFGKIWRAPFKLVGNIPKAAVSIVSESAEGVGHIVGAPFKGVAKLFGADEDDNDELDENM